MTMSKEQLYKIKPLKWQKVSDPIEGKKFAAETSNGFYFVFWGGKKWRVGYYFDDLDSASEIKETFNSDKEAKEYAQLDWQQRLEEHLIKVKPIRKPEKK